MPIVTLAPDVYCVGVKDPGLKIFDIVIPTEYGTTYNSYLVKGTEKTALIDCVKRPFAAEFLRNIEEILPVSKLDYVIVNHSEPDHAGALVELLERNPTVTVLLSRSAKTFVDNLVNAGFPFRIVGDDDELPLGGKTLRFINAPFLHWPDTILTYLAEDKILFPCDFLGAHYSSPHTFNDELHEPAKARKAFEFYYATIMRPYKEHILKTCERLKDLPEMQRKVLALYYGEDMHLREIAEVFGLTESRICQIHSQAIISIRAYLQRFEAGMVRPQAHGRNA